MIKVLFIDDEPRLRQAWERLFAAQGEFKVVAMLGHVDELPATVTMHTPDVVVMDLSIPGMDPFECIQELSEKSPTARVVVYSARSDVESKRAAFDAGAWAYVDKLADASEMFEIISRVARGEVVIPPEISGSK